MADLIDHIERRPIPDPTVLTTQQLFREIQALKEYLECKIETANCNAHGCKADVRHEAEDRAKALEGVIKYIEEHFRCNDDRFEKHLQANDSALRELKEFIVTGREGIKMEIQLLKSYHDESTRVIENRIDLLDKESSRRVNDAKSAVDAMFGASKEAVAEQNRTNNLAISKSESAFADQIRQLNINLQTINGAINDKIDDAKNRISLLETSSKAVEAHSGGIKDMWGYVVGIVGVFATIITLGMLIMEKSSNNSNFPEHVIGRAGPSYQ